MASKNELKILQQASKKAQSPNPLWISILESLFCQQASDLLTKVAPLTAETRQQLWQQYQTDLITLRKASRYSERQSFQAHRDQIGILNVVEYRSEHPMLSELWPEFAQHAHEIVAWIRKQKLNFFGSKDGYRYYLNIELLMAALADQSSAEKLAQMQGDQRFPFWDLSYHLPQRNQVPETQLEAYTLVWLDRPESWAKDCLAMALTSHLPQGASGEIYASVQAISSRWPDVAEKFLGKAVFLELYQREPEDYQPAELLAGLRWLAPLGVPDLGHFPIYAEVGRLAEHLGQVLSVDKPQTELIKLRSELIALIFERLRLSMRRQDLLAWIKLYRALTPDSSEQTRHQADYLALLQGPAKESVELALQTILNDISSYLSQPRLWLQLGLLFSFPTQKVALLAWRVWQTAVKLQPQALAPHETLVQALSSPHLRLREQVLKWLGKHPDSLTDEVFAQLRLLQDDTENPAEQERLRRLLPAAEPAIVDPARSQESQSQPKQAERPLLKPLAEFLPQQDLNHLPANDWDSDPLLEIPADLAAVDDLLQKVLHQSPSRLQLEILAQALLLHPLTEAEDRSERKRFLSPLLAVAGDFAQKSESEPGFVDVPRIMLSIWLHAWLGQASSQWAGFWEKLSAFHSDLAGWGQALFQALDQGQRFLLAQPEYLSGWISLRSFCERLQQSVWIAPESLHQALLRLAPEDSAAIWPVIERQFADPGQSQLHPKLLSILAFALGPLAQAEAIFAEQLAHFQAQPPEECLLQRGLFTPLELNSPWDYRLLIAAWQFRQRSGRLSPRLLAGFEALPWSDLTVEALPPDGFSDALGDLGSWEDILAAFNGLDLNSLAQPHFKSLAALPIDLQSWINQALDGSADWCQIPDSAFSFDAIMRQWPQLWPLSLHSQYEPGWSYQPAQQDLIWHFLRDYPLMAPAAFTVALARIDRHQATQAKRDLPKGSFLIDLLSLGHLPRVSLSPQLPTLVSLFASKPIRHRQMVLSLLQRALISGRLSSVSVVEALAQQFQSTQGFKFCLESLDSWADQTEESWGLSFCWFLLDHLWQDSTAIPMRNQTALLDWAYRLGQSARPQLSIVATHQLEAWAQASKRSARRDKAAYLLALIFQK